MLDPAGNGPKALCLAKRRKHRRGRSRRRPRTRSTRTGQLRFKPEPTGGTSQSLQALQTRAGAPGFADRGAITVRTVLVAGTGPGVRIGIGGHLALRSCASWVLSPVHLPRADRLAVPGLRRIAIGSRAAARSLGRVLALQPHSLADSAADGRRRARRLVAQKGRIGIPVGHHSHSGLDRVTGVGGVRRVAKPTMTAATSRQPNPRWRLRRRRTRIESRKGSGLPRGAGRYPGHCDPPRE